MAITINTKAPNPGMCCMCGARIFVGDLIAVNDDDPDLVRAMHQECYDEWREEQK